MTTEEFRGEFRQIDLDTLTGRVKVDGKHTHVYFANTPEMRAIVPGLLGRGEVTFHVEVQSQSWHRDRVVAIEPDKQTGASE